MTRSVPPRILFVTSTRIGDAVLSSGILAHLVETRPEARFTIACGPAAASLFAGVPRLERVIVMAKGPYAAHWRRLWAACVGARWDAVIDLRRSALAWTLCARQRLRLSGPSGLAHRVVENAGVLGLDPPPAPHLWTLPRHEEAATRLIPAGGPVLAVGPTANWRGKTWRMENFVELVARLTAPAAPFAGARVAVFAAPGEDAAPLLDALPPERRLPVTGEADLLTVFAALKRCAFYVGNDSGLMHLAATAGAPTLGLFGPSREEHYAPWGPGCAVARTALAYDQLVGGPGYDHRTTGTLMDSLSVEAAETAALALISAVRGNR